MNFLEPDLFSFAYVPGWYDQLDTLAGMARPEPWRFRAPIYSTKNQDTPILERYIHAIFKKQAMERPGNIRESELSRLWKRQTARAHPSGVC